MSGRTVLALRMDERAALCTLVDVATLRTSGAPIIAHPCAGVAGATGLIERALRQAQRDRNGVAVLALALPPGGAWCGMREALELQFSLPSIRQSIAQATMQGERLQGAAAGRSSAVLFDTDNLDTALLLNAKPYKGASGKAGGVAHLGLDRTGRTRCACGRVGCLAALIEAGDEAPTPPLPAGGLAMPSNRHGWLAVACMALLNIVNPEVLILVGTAAEDDEAFAWLADTVRRGCLAPTRAGLAAVTRARTESALLGAAAFAIDAQAQPADQRQRRMS